MNNEKQNKMAVMPMGKLVFSMSLPLMISLLVQSLYNIVDGIFVARISENALTATSLAYPIQVLMIAVSVGTGVGVNALISRQIGAKQKEAANQTAVTGLVISVICAAFFMLLGIFFADDFGIWFTDDPVTGELCGSYLSICMIFCLGIFVETLAQRLLQSVGLTLLSMISLVVGAVVNLILDPIMIFGLFGCPEMGICGAAIATVIGQWMGAGVALALNRFKNTEIHLSWKKFKMTKDCVWAIYKVGFPTIVMQAIGSIMLFSVNAILMSFSATAVAFYGVYYKLQNFLMMPINGLGQAAIPIVGFNYGAKDKDRIKAVLKTMLPFAVGFALFGTVLFMAIPSQILTLFAAGSEMLAIGVPALRIISVTFALAAVSIILGFTCSGLGNGVINMVGTALRQLILLVPAIYLFTANNGIQSAWFAMWISEGIAVVYCILSTRKEFQKKVDIL